MPRLTWLLWAAFALFVVAAMFLLLRACGLVLPGYGSWHHVGWAFCSASTTAAQADDERQRLLKSVAVQLELRILREQIDCLAELPSPRPSDPQPVQQATPQRPQRPHPKAPSQAAAPSSASPPSSALAPQKPEPSARPSPQPPNLEPPKRADAPPSASPSPSRLVWHGLGTLSYTLGTTLKGLQFHDFGSLVSGFHVPNESETLNTTTCKGLYDMYRRE